MTALHRLLKRWSIKYKRRWLPRMNTLSQSTCTFPWAEINTTTRYKTRQRVPFIRTITRDVWDISYANVNKNDTNTWIAAVKNDTEWCYFCHCFVTNFVSKTRIYVSLERSTLAWHDLWPIRNKIDRSIILIGDFAANSLRRISQAIDKWLTIR